MVWFLHNQASVSLVFPSPAELHFLLVTLRLGINLTGEWGVPFSLFIMLSNFCCFSRINTAALFFERRLPRLLRKAITVVHTGVSSFKERKLTEPFRLQEKTTHYQAYCPTRPIKDSKHPDYTLNHHDL